MRSWSFVFVMMLASSFLALSQDISPKSLLRSAEEAIATGRLSDAMVSYNQLVETTPSASAFLHRGRLHSRLKAPREAASDFTVALTYKTHGSSEVEGKSSAEIKQSRLQTLLSDKEALRIAQLRTNALLALAACDEAIQDMPNSSAFTTPSPPTPDTKPPTVSTLKDFRTALDKAEKCAGHFTQLEKMPIKAVHRMSAPQRERATVLIGLIMTLVGESNEGVLDLLLLRSRLRLLSNELEEAIADTQPVLKAQPSNLGALSVRAEAYLQLGEFKHSADVCRRVLQLDPDHPVSQRIFKRARLLQRKFEDATAAESQPRLSARLFSDLLSTATTPVKTTPSTGNSKLVVGEEWALGIRRKLCSSLTKVGNDTTDQNGLTPEEEAQEVAAAAAAGGAPQVVRECQSVVELLSKSKRLDAQERARAMVEAHLAVSTAWSLAGDAQQALNSAKQAEALAPHDRNVLRRVHEAEARLKEASRKDYYKILGIARTASRSQVKAAYRALAKQFHPDMVAESEKDTAQDRFREVSEAYEVLFDKEKRAKYDRGEDLDAPQGQGQGGFHGGFPGGFPGGFSGFGGGGGFNFNF